MKKNKKFTFSDLKQLFLHPKKINPIGWFIIALLFSINSYGANYYWIDGAGNWSDINHWATTSGGSNLHSVVPSQNDDVFFDANSGFENANNTVVLNSTAQNCHDITWNGALASPVFEASNTNALNVYGSMGLQNDLTYNVGKTNFLSPTLGETITTSNTPIHGQFIFNATGGWTLQDSLKINYDNPIIFYQGHLNTNAQVIVLTSNYGGFMSTGNKARVLTIANSVIIINVTHSSANWYYLGSNNTLNASNSLVKFEGSYYGTAYLRTSNNHHYHNVLFNSNSSSAKGLISPNSNSDTTFFNKVEFKNGGLLNNNNNMDTLIFNAGNTYTLQANVTQTVNHYLDCYSPACSQFISIISPSNQANLFLTPGMNTNLSNIVFQNINALGAIPLIANNSFDLGNNSNITIAQPAAKVLYWVGGAGEWNDALHWSSVNDGVYPPMDGGCLPTPADDVVFNNNSGFEMSNNTVVLNKTTQYCHDINWNGALANPVFEASNTNVLSVYGSMSLQNDLTYNVAKTNFLSPTLGETITTSNIPIHGQFIFNATGGWTLQDSLKINYDNPIIFYQGHLNTNAQVLVLTSNYGGFMSTGNKARVLTIANSVIIINVAHSSANWYYSGSNNTLNASNSLIKFEGSYYGTAYLRTSNNHHYHNVLFNSNSSSAKGLISPNSNSDTTFFNKVEFKNGGLMNNNNNMDTLIFNAGNTYTLQANVTQTVNHYLDCYSPACSQFISIISPSDQANLFLSPGMNTNLSNVVFQNINALGSIPLIADNSFDLGNNTNITIAQPAAKVLYWVGGAGEWNDALHWSSVNDGVYPPMDGGCLPTPADDVVFNNNSGFEMSNNTVVLNKTTQYCHDINWNGALASPVFEASNTNVLSVYGSMSLQNDMTYNVGVTNFLSPTLGETITTSNTPIHGQFIFNATGGWTLQDSLKINYDNPIIFYQGHLNTNAQVLVLTSNYGGFMSTGNKARVLTIANSVIIINVAHSGANWYYSGSNNTLNASNSLIRLEGSYYGTAYLRSSNNHHYHNVLFNSNSSSAKGLINPNSNSDTTFFNKVEFKNGGFLNNNNTMDTLIFNGGNTYTLQADRTQTVNRAFFGSGNPCFITYIESSSSGQQAHLNVLAGPVLYDFVTLQDINATASYSTLLAESHSTDAGNNTNININPASTSEIIGLGPDTTLNCSITTYTIRTDGFFPNPNTQFLWNDNSTADSLIATELGQYHIKVDYGEACIIHDTLNIYAVDTIKPTLTCQSANVFLDENGTVTIEPTDLLSSYDDNCGIASVLISSASMSTFDCTYINSTQEVSVIVTDYEGNLDSCTSAVTILDNIAPVVTCPEDQTQITGANCQFTLADYTSTASVSDNCGATITQSPIAGTLITGNTVVSLTATDNGGNTQVCTFNVTGNDETAPEVNCQDLTVYLDATGTTSISASQLNDGSTDNCGITSMTVNQTEFNCNHLDVNTITLTVTDLSDNSSTCTSTITVLDTISPVLSCPEDQMAATDANCQFTLIDYTSLANLTDNCGATLSQSPIAGTIVTGNTLVSLTATDNSGNSKVCSFNVMVNDITAPESHCQNISVYLDPTGHVSILAEDIDDGSTDNCGIASISIDQTDFDCNSINENTVNLTVTDYSNNSSSCASTVTVLDTIAPVISCPENQTATTDANCQFTLPDYTSLASVSDICGATLSQSPASGTSVSENTIVSLTATDNSGNTKVCSFTLSLNDITAPESHCQNATVYLDPNGNASITAAQIDNGSSDNCGIASMALDQSSFNCNHLGANTVIFTLSDLSDNSSTCNATVTVLDTIAPELSCPENQTHTTDANCQFTLMDYTAMAHVSDNCEATISQSPSVGTTVTGNTQIILTATDQSGNTQLCAFTIMANDIITPVASCQNLSVYLDETGHANIDASQIDAGSFDKCGLVTVAIDQSNFDCPQLGDNTVVLTVTDLSSNSSTCTSTVSVFDTIAPIVDCPISQNTDADFNCTYIIEDYTSLVSTSKACNASTLSISQIPEAGTEITATSGETLVKVIATDLVGNSDTCTFSLMVDCGMGLSIPGFFSPNSDGKNDTWEIIGIKEYSKASVQVFNRWGDLVFEMENYDNSWDGTSLKGSVSGSGGELPEGTYFYILEIKKEKSLVKNGYIELRR